MLGVQPPPSHLDFDSASDRDLAPRPTPTFEHLYTATHKAPVRVCNFSPDGNLFATGAVDGSVRVSREAEGVSMCTQCLSHLLVPPSFSTPNIYVTIYLYALGAIFGNITAPHPYATIINIIFTYAFARSFMPGEQRRAETRQEMKCGL